MCFEHTLDHTTIRLGNGPTNSNERYLILSDVHGRTIEELASWKYGFDTRLNHVTIKDSTCDVRLLLLFLAIADLLVILYGA